MTKPPNDLPFWRKRWIERYQEYGDKAENDTTRWQEILFIDSNQREPRRSRKAELLAQFAARCGYMDVQELWLDSYTAEQFNGALKLDVAEAVGHAKLKPDHSSSRIARMIASKDRLLIPEENEPDIDFEDDIKAMLSRIDLEARLDDRQKDNIRKVASILKKTRHDIDCSPESIDISAWHSDKEVFHAVYAQSKARSLVKQAWREVHPDSNKSITFNRADLALMSELENQFSPIINKPEEFKRRRWVIVSQDGMVRRETAAIAAAFGLDCSQGDSDAQVRIMTGKEFDQYMQRCAKHIVNRFEQLRNKEGYADTAQLFSGQDRADWREFIATFGLDTPASAPRRY